MYDLLTRRWWAFAIQGIAAVIFGILTIVWPGTSLRVMIALFGAFALVTGVMHVAGAFEAAWHHQRWGSLLAAGILGIVIALVTWFWPGLTALAVLYLVVAWALVTGVAYVVSSVELREVTNHAWLMTLAGILSIALAVVLAVDPRDGILSLVWVVGIYAVMFGVAELVFAFRLHGVQEDISSAASRLVHST